MENCKNCMFWDVGCELCDSCSEQLWQLAVEEMEQEIFLNLDNATWGWEQLLNQ